MLTAVRVPSELARAGESYVLLVDPHTAAEARSHLLQYQKEVQRPGGPAPPPPPRLHAHAWIGCALYSAVLIAVAYAVNNGIWRLDAFDVGELDAAAVQGGSGGGPGRRSHCISGRSISRRTSARASGSAISPAGCWARESPGPSSSTAARAPTCSRDCSPFPPAAPQVPRQPSSRPWGCSRRTPGGSAATSRRTGRSGGARSSRASCFSAGSARQAPRPTSLRISPDSRSAECSAPWSRLHSSSARSRERPSGSRAYWRSARWRSRGCGLSQAERNSAFRRVH